ncbi:hypothetical protein [Palleniella muris]|uniref:hypothetical protein n=1 Tax=Palleniella muris TaxID=3038145 RepID=UPI0024101895|nr:hypothetical protein [Palleniella muris]
MKKILYTIMALAISAFALQSCEDVPEPYDIPGQETGGDQGGNITVEPAGDGTEANPYNVAAALQIISALDETGKTEPMYVKGKISSIRQVETAQYGNANYYISDDGSSSNTLYIFQSLYLGNVKFTSEDQIKEGDEVVIYGRFVNYLGNTPETEGKGTSYIYSLNGQTAGGGDKPALETKGSGTEADPWNVGGIINFTSALGKDEQSSENVYFKGIVSSVENIDVSNYGNATFRISDDGKASNEFYVFRCYGLNNEKFTSADAIQVGDEVVICGLVTNYYGNTPETVAGKAYVYSIKKGEGTPTPAPAGFDFSKQGYQNQQDFDGKAINYDENTTMTFSKGSGSTTPKYYNTGTAMRMYGSNVLTVSSSKVIKTIIITFASGEDQNARPYYATDGNSSFSPSNVSLNNNIATWSVGGNTATLTYTTMGGHFRVKTINIEYAE